MRSVFTVWLRAVDADPVMPDAAGGVFVDAVVAIVALAAAIGRRFLLPTVSPAGLPRVFRTVDFASVYAASCEFMYSLRTSCGVR